MSAEGARRTLARMTVVLAGVIVAAALWSLVITNAAGAQTEAPSAAPPVVTAGPDAGIVALSGLSVARDGSGGLVFVKRVAGIDHLFLSRLVAGAFQTPVQVDAGLSGPSSQPVIAAGVDGVLLVAFINGGALCVVDVTGAAAPITAPILLFQGASNPAAAMTTLGKAYIAFAATDGTGSDVRVAYDAQGSWSVEPAPLNVVPADDAGTGSGRPALAAAGDGVAIVAWGEGGHVYSRRVWGLEPSVVDEQADVPSLSGWSEVSAGDARIGSGGDSTYASVAFDETFTNGATEQSRVLRRRLIASGLAAVTGADGLSTPGADGADAPAVATGEYGNGILTSARQSSDEVFAALVGDNGTAGAIVRVDSLANATAPLPVPAVAGRAAGLVAWQHDPGSGGAADVRARFLEGSTFGPELVLSPSGLGATDAAGGLAASGDASGDVAVAWVQGTGDSTRIVTDEVLVSPGSFRPAQSFQYARTQTPVLAWSAPRETWGPLTYLVSVNGQFVTQTTGTSAVLTLPVGPNTWQVTAVNGAGLTNTTAAAEVWVDPIPPTVSLALSGKRQAGSKLSAAVRYTDAPPPLPPPDAAGIASVVISWGDGPASTVTKADGHVYRRPGTYRLTVTATDRAGNVTTLVRTLRITAKPKRKPPRKTKATTKTKPTTKPKVTKPRRATTAALRRPSRASSRAEKRAR